MSVGFSSADIRVVANTNRVTLQREVDQFAQRAATLRSTDIAFFYYSGHGAWRPNARSMSLIPIDASDASSTDFWYSTVNLDSDVLQSFRNAGSDAAWIVAIDACRNELKLPTRSLGGADKSFGIVPSAAGMLISFAADEGQTARDIAPGARYSPYAAALIETLARPGLSLSSLFGSVRPNVMKRTGGAQEPVLTNKLNYDPILLRTSVANSGPSSTATPQVSCSKQPAPFVVYYEWDRTDLTASNADTIRAAVAAVRRSGCPIKSVVVDAYTDSSGSAEYNIRKSASQAESVKSVLIAAGVDASLIRTSGRGEADPASPRPDGVREPLNRRAEIQIAIGP